MVNTRRAATGTSTLDTDPREARADEPRDSHPTLSVVIVNFNGEEFLRPCLASLRRQTFRDLEVIVVDNASSDQSTTIIANEYPEVRLLGFPENRHFCAGNNAGLNIARGRYIAFLNNDTWVVPEWAERIVEAFEQNPQVGAITTGICANRGFSPWLFAVVGLVPTVIIGYLISLVTAPPKPEQLERMTIYTRFPLRREE